jgi:hypothetical protein
VVTGDLAMRGDPGARSVRRRPEPVIEVTGRYVARAATWRESQDARWIAANCQDPNAGWARGLGIEKLVSALK